jgi:D-alanyl-D-alanine carboxypeptidase/D-alanyl-D-alanine-endopeptidase (penicillin-binding protein 4)
MPFARCVTDTYSTGCRLWCAAIGLGLGVALAAYAPAASAKAARKEVPAHAHHKPAASPARAGSARHALRRAPGPSAAPAHRVARVVAPRLDSGEADDGDASDVADTADAADAAERATRRLTEQATTLPAPRRGLRPPARALLRNAAGAAREVPERPEALPPVVAHALERAHVPLSDISVLVQRIGAARPLIALNAAQPMQPASTMKLVTTWSGLSILGPDYRWRTSAYAAGQVSNGTLHGNLYIEGSGDPKLVPEELAELIQRIHRAGIMAIDGDLVLDKHRFDPSTRNAPPLDDNASAPYNVGPDPLLYSFKSLAFTFDAASSDSVSISVQPALSQLQVVNDLHVTRGRCTSASDSIQPMLDTQPDGILRATFSGNFARACGAQASSVAVLDHASFFAGGFVGLWRQTGGTFNGIVREARVPAMARLVATHRSPTLAEIVRDINKYSNNVMARNLFLSIGAQSSRQPASTASSAAAVRKFLTQSALPMPGLVMDNGSGLSRDGMISADAMGSLLIAANSSPVAQVFIGSLPIVGVDGTMRHRLTNAPLVGNAHIKTGTLNNVRAIAGYVGAASGDSYVVVSFINDAHAGAARAAHDALLEWVYELPH